MGLYTQRIKRGASTNPNARRPGRPPQGEPTEKVCLALRADVIRRLDEFCLLYNVGRSRAVALLITKVKFPQQASEAQDL